MNEFAVNLASQRVDDGYLEILVVGKAFIEKMLRECFAMRNRVGIGFELQSNPIPHGDAIFHIEEKFCMSVSLGSQPWFVTCASWIWPHLVQRRVQCSNPDRAAVMR